MVYHLGVIANGDELDRINKMVLYLEQVNSRPVGFKWNTASSSPTVTIIDIHGTPITPDTAFFNRHTIWGNIGTCVRNRTDGIISYGTNNAGAGLDLTGTSGDVFGETPTGMVKYLKTGNDVCIWVAPYESNCFGFENHPCVPQRGGVPRSKIYVAAYEGGMRLDSSGNRIMTSVSGVPPWTGGGFHSLAYTSGSTEFIIDETLTGATSGATGIVAAYRLASGTWAGGDAAGTVYIEQCSETAFVSENLNGSSSGSDCATISGDASAVTLTMTQAEAAANLNGSGIGICNVHSYSWLTLLQIIEAGSLDIQTKFGKGIVDLPTGYAPAGKRTGADEIDTHLDDYGTGVGLGINGVTTTSWRGFRNLCGNVAELMIGLTLNPDGAYRILKSDGTSTPAESLGTFDSGTGVSTSSGYISALVANKTATLAFLPSAVGGSTTTYLCDSFGASTVTGSIVRRGSLWSGGWAAGPTAITAMAPGTTTRSVGARLEYITQ